MKDMPPKKEEATKTKTATAIGTVTAVNRANRKVTLDHGPITDINWPAVKKLASYENGISGRAFRRPFQAQGGRTSSVHTQRLRQLLYRAVDKPPDREGGYECELRANGSSSR